MDPRGEPVISTWKRPCQQIQNGSEFPELVANLLAQKITASGRRVCSPSYLPEFFVQIRAESHIPKSLTKHKFRALAIESKTLTDVKLSATYPLVTARYYNGNFTGYELALSLRPESYL